MNNRKKISLSIAIPVYNNEQTIGSLVAPLIKELQDEYFVDIVLVNNDSNNNTEKVCMEMYCKYIDIVKFYSLAKNFGEHNAVMVALNIDTCDFDVIIDEDFQIPVSEVKKLVSYAKDKEYDMDRRSKLIMFLYQIMKRSLFLKSENIR